jgi:aminoglycoside phosphotransferase (APT) family kinase protein
VSGLAPLAGGNARRAWAFTIQWRQEGRELSRECVLLARVEAGQLEVDAQWEFDVLRGLAGHGLPAPQALAVDADGAVLGMQGLVMRRGTGRGDITELLQPQSPITGPLAEQLVRIAARLHSVAWPDAPRAWQPARMLHDWRARFEGVRLEPLPALGLVFDWLEDHLPAPVPAALVHGDLRLGNFLHDASTITLLLDWELSHVGDPAEDLAWMYRRLWSPQAFLPFERAVALYEQAGAQPIERSRLDWYRVFAEARHAVISLSAVRSFADGRTRNLRHAGRGSMVNECLLAALRRIDALEAAAC